MSDGECNEGSVWEAAMFITGKKLKNILVFIDCNKWQATDKTDDILKFEPIKKKWQSFGWSVKEINDTHLMISKIHYYILIKNLCQQLSFVEQ